MRRLRWKWQSLQQVWIGWRVNRLAKAGAYDDPITTRRRLAKAARFEGETDEERQT